jgi:hypothetical protein
MLIEYVWDVCWDTLETVFHDMVFQAVFHLPDVQRTVGGLDDAVSHVYAVLEQREDLGRWVDERVGIECLRKFYNELRIAEKSI